MCGRLCFCSEGSDVSQHGLSVMKFPIKLLLVVLAAIDDHYLEAFFIALAFYNTYFFLWNKLWNS